MHDAAGDDDVLGRRETGLNLLQKPQQPEAGQSGAVVMDLQRADAGRQVDDAGEARRDHRFHQQMHAEPQRNVEAHRAIFDEQIVVALTAVNYFDRAIVAPPDNRGAGLGRAMNGGTGNRIA